MPTVRKRGSKWQAQVRLKQSGVIVFSESATFDTEREAKRWANALEDRVLRDGVEAHYTQSATITSLAKVWLQYKEKVKPPVRGGPGDTGSGAHQRSRQLERPAQVHPPDTTKRTGETQCS